LQELGSGLEDGVGLAAGVWRRVMDVTRRFALRLLLCNTNRGKRLNQGKRQQ